MELSHGSYPAAPLPPAAPAGSTHLAARCPAAGAVLRHSLLGALPGTVWVLVAATGPFQLQQHIGTELASCWLLLRQQLWTGRLRVAGGWICRAPALAVVTPAPVLAVAKAGVLTPCPCLCLPARLPACLPGCLAACRRHNHHMDGSRDWHRYCALLPGALTCRGCPLLGRNSCMARAGSCSAAGLASLAGTPVPLMFACSCSSLCCLVPCLPAFCCCQRHLAAAPLCRLPATHNSAAWSAPPSFAPAPCFTSHPVLPYCLPYSGLHHPA